MIAVSNACGAMRVADIRHRTQWQSVMDQRNQPSDSQGRQHEGFILRVTSSAEGPENEWKKLQKVLACCLSIFIIILVVLTSLLVAKIVFSHLNEKDRRAQFRNLLAGDLNGRIVSIRIEGKNGLITITDSASLEYLATAIQSAKPDASVSGVTYLVTIAISSGDEMGCRIFVPSGSNKLGLSFPDEVLFDDPEYFEVDLPKPIPDPLAGVLTQLRPS